MTLLFNSFLVKRTYLIFFLNVYNSATKTTDHDLGVPGQAQVSRVDWVTHKPEGAGYSEECPHPSDRLQE